MANIGNQQLLKSLKPYLKVRHREDVFAGIAEGICNGVSMLMLMSVYEGIHTAFQKNPDGEKIEENIKQALDQFFARLEAVAAYQESPHQEIAMKTARRHTPAWRDANLKLNHAIDKGQLKLTDVDRSKPRFNELLRLAIPQNILMTEEAKVLQEAHLPDVSLIEDFLNEVIWLQQGSNYLDNISQTALEHLFPYLYQSADVSHPNPIAVPINETGFDLVLTPLELIEQCSTFIPENKPVLLSLPHHSTCVVRIGNQYQFYDINLNERLPFVATAEIMACLISRNDLANQAIEAKKSFDMSKVWALEDKIKKLDILIDRVINESDEEVRRQLIKSNVDQLSPFLGFSLTIFSHPSQTRANWQSLQLPSESVNRRDSIGETPLWKACALGHFDFAKKLLSAGASPHVKRDDGVSAFYMASQHNDIPMLELLHANGVEVDTQNSDGKTALIAAIMNGNMAVAKWLLAHGADVTLGYLDADGAILTPLVQACDSGRTDIVQLLLEHGAKRDTKENERNPLLYACFTQDHGIIKLLLDNQFDPDAKDPQDRTPLMYAAAHGNIEMMQMLLDAGAKINLKNDESETALAVAVSQGHADAAFFLLQQGACCNSIPAIETSSGLDKTLENIIQFYPSVLLKGATLAEKVGMLFDMTIQKTNPTFFNANSNPAAIVIRDTLLAPNNRNWTVEQISAFLDQHTADDQVQDKILIEMMSLSKNSLLKQVTKQPPISQRPSLSV